MVGIAGDFLEFAVGFVEIHLAVGITGGEGLPCHLGFLARVPGLEVDFLLRREFLPKALAVSVVKRSDNLPIGQKTEMAGQVDLLFQVGEGLGDCLDLIDITRGVEGLAVGDGGGVPGFLRELLCALGDQQRHRIASQSGAGIIKEPGDQGFRCSAVDGQHEVEGESAGLRSLGPVREEGLQIGKGKGLLFSEFTFHDHFHGRAQPVASDPVAGLDGTQERQQGGGPGLGE